jgi:hypothetical protein
MTNIVNIAWPMITVSNTGLAMIALQRSTIGREVGVGLGGAAATASVVLELGFTLCL